MKKSSDLWKNVFKLIVGRDPDCRAEAVNFINGGAKIPVTCIKKESVLETKVMEMRDEHERKLSELQDAQRKQLSVIRKNEEKLREIVDGHQSTIGELNKQNSKLFKNSKYYNKWSQYKSV